MASALPPPTISEFKVFERLHASDSAYPGTGIGLALVQKAIERMSGVVGVESTPGEGSLFWIELPDDERLGTRIDSGKEAGVRAED